MAANPALDHLARAAGLTIDPLHEAGVALNLERLLTQARLVMDVALPPDTEPAPIFRP